MRLHRLEQVKIDEALRERARRLELGLVGLQEVQHTLQILRALAFGVEQTLPEAAAVDAGIFLVDAQGEGRTVPARKHERIAAHERRDVFGVPRPVFVDIEIFVVADAEQGAGHDPGLFPRKHDRVFDAGRLEFRRHQRHRIHILGKSKVDARFDRYVLVLPGIDLDRTFINQELLAVH